MPYGRPLANQAFAVLDDRLQPRPDWVAGDLYISGDGLALGYWNDPEKTAGAFLPAGDGHPRLYRTGDTARYHDDGTLEFLGRQGRAGEDPRLPRGTRARSNPCSRPILR